MTLIASTRPLWFVTRGSGVVALLLLTASVVLGIGVAVRWRGRRWPRFALTSTHRNLTLLSIVFVAIHVATTVADGYAPISLVAVAVPFASPYRPVWLGLGAISFDLLVALVLTSLARARVPPRLWRGLHWLAYLAWPVALLHAFGTGSDARFGWFALLGFGCLAAVAVAVVLRVARGPGRGPARALGAAAALVTPLAVLVWYQSGPLQQGWARRAGTPAALLARGAGASHGVRNASLTRAAPGPPTSFVAALSGTISQAEAPGGLVDVRMSLRLRGGPKGAAKIYLRGIPAGGGVTMTAGGVSFVPATTRQVYTGRVVALAGTQVIADVQDSWGDRLRLGFSLRIDPTAGSVSGVVTAATHGSDE